MRSRSVQSISRPLELDVKPDLKAAASAIESFLAAIGAPSDDPELANTGERVARAYVEELLTGYGEDPAEILAEVTASEGRDMVTLTDIPTVTMCPHHLMPSAGLAHVAYVPAGNLIGLGALGRLVDCFARRFQLQESLSAQIADALMAHTGARGAACTVDLSPGCVTCRGERRSGVRAVSTAFRGIFEQEHVHRMEFLAASGNVAPAT